MRVLEAVPSISYKMGKNRKHRIRKAKENDADDSSDDGLVNGCPHVSKAVNIASVRKCVKQAANLGECASCAKDGTKSPKRDLFGGIIEGPVPAAEGDDADFVEPTICICLQCGHQGCDRNSQNKHALKHHKTPHSGQHCIIVNLTTWSTWCYLCDDEVQPSTRIQGCIELLQKHSGLSKPDSATDSARIVESTVSEASSIPLNSPSMKNNSTVSCAKVKGLKNLGNTCFFNAVMQSMCQTTGLESLLLERSKQGRLTTIAAPDLSLDSDSEEDKEEDVQDKLKQLPSIQTVYGDPGPITLAMLSFVQEMKGSSTKNGVVNPSILFTQVCKKAPRFKGFQQQDSHELLRYLVDCIRTEEIRRGQGSILKHFKLPETINPKKVDDETKTKLREYGRYVKHTFLDSVFGGQLVSTVKCEECKNVSQIYEAFLDLSLPVMEEKPQRPNLILIGKKKDSVSLADVGDDYSVSAAAGLDAYTDKPSKHQEKKNKQLAKKQKKSKKYRPLDQHDSGVKMEAEEKAVTPEHGAVSDDGNKCVNDSHKDLEMTSPTDSQTVVEEDSSLMISQTTPELEGNGNAVVSSATADSSPDGSKDDGDENGEERASSNNDPSDADIEDNLESLDGAKTVPRSPDGSGDSVKNDNNLNGDLVQKETIPSLETFDSNGVLDNENNKLKGEETPSDNLVSAMQGLSVLDESAGGAEMPVVFTCEASVQNADSSSDAKTVGQEGSSVVLNGSHGDFVVCNGLDDSMQVSATFNVNIPNVNIPTVVLEAAAENAEDFMDDSATHLSSQNISDGDLASSQPLVENGNKQEVKEDEDKVHLLHNLHKTKMEYMKAARQHSMNTLAPRYQPAPKECSILSCLNQFTAAELLTGSNKFGCKECTKNKLKNSAPQKAEKRGKEIVLSNANKQYLIFRPPSVLTLHLKRFEQTGLTSRKVNRHVDFPLVLDLAPYCSSLCSGVKENQTKVLYSLYGIVEHSGRLTGGHYTAYIKVRPGVSSHTRFLHTQPPGPLDILNVYMERILKKKDNPLRHCDVSGEKPDLPDNVDKDLESKAESFVPPGRWFHISDCRVNEVAEEMVLRAQAYLLFYERIF